MDFLNKELGVIIFMVLGRLAAMLVMFAITTFLAVALGLLDYLLIQEVVSLHPLILGGLGVVWTFSQILNLIVAAVVICLLTCVTVGVFVWGLLAAAETALETS